MSGYDGFSMSNNAREAYSMGKLPASKIAKEIGRGATAAGVAKVLRGCEWHHTSSHYNETVFYDYAEEIEDYAEDHGISQQEATGILDARIIEASKAAAYKPITRTDCTVEWVEWAGTRNHPKAINHRVEGCIVEDTGKTMLRITLPDGKVMRKKRDGEHLKITTWGGIS